MKLLKEGTKYDTGKSRYDLIPPFPLEQLAKLYTTGAIKYAERNWEKGMKWSRCFSALMRHAWAFWSGETYDKETKIHHMVAVAFCAFSLIEYNNTHPEFDDRPNGSTKFKSKR